jgi:hypothetical protein
VTDWINALAAAVMAGVTVALWRLNRQQVAIAKATGAALMRIERAYVGMSHYSPGVTFSPPMPPDGVIVVNASVRITNSGNTPARVTSYKLGFWVTDAALPVNPPLDEIPVTRVDAFLSKGESLDVSSEGDAISQAIHTSIARGNARVFLMGYVDYIDQFEVRHRAFYAREYHRAIDSITLPAYEDPSSGLFSQLLYSRRNNLMFVGAPGYNRDRPREADEGIDW